MIGLVIWLVIFLILIVVVKYVVDALELPPPLRKVVLLVLALIGLLILLHELGLFGAGRIIVV